MHQLFLATGATREGDPEAVSLTEVKGLMRDGRISDGPSLTAPAVYLATR